MIRLKRLYAHDFKQLQEIDLFFPEAGRILVQGKNEAGKSTLFEAVFFALFGQALATENAGRPNLDDLIAYDKNKARVELDLIAGDRLFRIIRTLNRDRPNVWQLEIVKGDQTEEIRGNKAVNDSLVSELGFDAEALLNTCFVEQKKLEKLEGMNKSKREESLSKLLNLERLLDLEDKLRLRGDDEKLLNRLARRVELADAQQQLPTTEEDLEKAQGQLFLLDLSEQVQRAVEEKRALVELDRQRESLRADRDRSRAVVGQVDMLDRARKAVNASLDRYDLVAGEAASLQAKRRERDEIERAVNQTLPILQVRARGLGQLARHLGHLIQVESIRGTANGDLQRIDAAQQELGAQFNRGTELNAVIAECETRTAQLDQMLKNYEAGDALGQWATLALELRSARSSEGLLVEKTAGRQDAERKLRSGLIPPVIVLIAMIALTVLIPLALLPLTQNVILAGVSGAVLAIVDIIVGFLVTRRAARLWNALERATAELGQAQGQAAAQAQAISALEDRLRGAEARLTEFQVPIPQDPDAGLARRVELAATLENKTREEIASEREAVREKFNYARAQRDDVVKRIEGLNLVVEGRNAGEFNQTLAKADRIVAERRPQLVRQAAQLDIEPDYQTVREAWQAAEQEQSLWRTRIQEASKLAEQIKQGQARIDSNLNELQRVYGKARDLVADASCPPWSDTLPRSALLDLESTLAAAFEAKGGERVRSELNGIENRVGACESEIRLREKSFTEATRKSHVLLQQIGIQDSFSPEPSLEELETFAGKLDGIAVEERSTLQARVNQLHQRVGALRGTRDKLERELGLTGETVDLAPAREQLEKETRNQEERKYAAEIVLRARKRIVKKILPATMEYMRRILPQLTRDRYHDADLDDESYKIRVWDERAGQSGAWKEKNIFSGGTKDQFSLALRLAFALATLPQERGTSPGFIFLDEPLGSFDDERAAALLYLLTEGEIGRAFDQILLISHVRVSESRFTHHLRLEDGKVAETDLGG